VAELGKRLTALRGTRSQREVAKAAGLDVSTVSRIERGSLDPTFSTLTALARALTIDVRLLVYIDETGPIAPPVREPAFSAFPSVESSGGDYPNLIDARTEAVMRRMREGPSPDTVRANLKKVVPTRAEFDELDRTVAQLAHLLDLTLQVVGPAFAELAAAPQAGESLQRAAVALRRHDPRDDGE
jgi:transcriptional regulator with XRE-family HTH domain